MRTHLRRQCGLTLIEMMIASTLGLFLLLAVTGLLLSTKSGYVAQDQQAQILETGRYAVDIISRSVRQAGYEHAGSENLLITAAADASANVDGLDASTLKKTTPELSSPLSTDVVNGSDVLALRFFGDGTADGNGAILNCAGLVTDAPDPVMNAADQRGWSIFFVALDSAGEPELRCKYQSKTSWSSDAIARGIESFQVLYGIDTDGNGWPDRFVSAARLDEMDNNLTVTGPNAVARAADKNRKTYWKKVRAIRFSLLVRGSEPSRDDVLTVVYDLFGKEYGDQAAQVDKGVRIEEKSLPAATRNRIRKIFTQTIHLRNDPAGSAT